MYVNCSVSPFFLSQLRVASGVRVGRSLARTRTPRHLPARSQQWPRRLRSSLVHTSVTPDNIRDAYEWFFPNPFVDEDCTAHGPCFPLVVRCFENAFGRLSLVIHSAMLVTNSFFLFFSRTLPRCSGPASAACHLFIIPKSCSSRLYHTLSSYFRRFVVIAISLTLAHTRVTTIDLPLAPASAAIGIASRVHSMSRPKVSPRLRSHCICQNSHLSGRRVYYSHCLAVTQ